MRHLSTILLNRLTAFAAVLICTAAAPVHAQSTIENVAQIEWDAGTARVAKSSNRVKLNVQAPVITPISLETFRLSAGGESQSVAGTMCQGSAGAQPIQLGGVYANTPLAPATFTPAASIRAGEPLVFALTSISDNQDQNQIDTKTVTLETPSGDNETITLRETAPNSARFVGIINTMAMPPAPVKGDCRLSVTPGESFSLAGLDAASGSLIARAPIDVLIDPFGIVFDSGDGAPVPGTRVTLIDADTGLPAQVFGDDGVSSFPSSLLTGSTVTDSSGRVYAFPTGDYRFPFARAGRYRLLVEAPSPYTSPSASSPAELAHLRRPDGPAYTIVSGSYGGIFVLDSPAPVRIDIPVDRPGAPIMLQKTASQAVAMQGDAVQYRLAVSNPDTTRSTGAITLTDKLPVSMRLRRDTVRLDGAKIAYNVSADGRTLEIPLAALAPGQSKLVTYLLEVRPDAQPGTAINTAQARDNRGAQSLISDANVRIARDGISDRITIIGRVTMGGCSTDPKTARGIPGVRVMLEDGSYAVTDLDGRYHFDGVIPGIHVVQMDPSSLPAGQVPAQCTDNARSGNNAISRFVDGRGGALLRVDFRTTDGENASRLSAQTNSRTAPLGSAEAAGAERDWVQGQSPGIDWLFPETDHNPRTKAVRVAIKHLPRQSVRLSVAGQPVDPIAFDGVRKSTDGTVFVSTWRAVEIADRDTLMIAEIVDESGHVVETLRRTVHLSASPMRGELLKDKSLLIADGITRPVIAVRFTDRDGRPARAGMTGDFSVPAPYYPAVEIDAQNSRQLSGLERAQPVWHIEGDDGIAYIKLEPTTASGSVNITLPFRDGDATRTERLDLWLDPGKRPWTVVGFAAGTAGFSTLNNNLERLGADGQHWYTDARIALYAKGRVKGKWLMTLAYDSDKARDNTRFGGVIDPNSYYTIYADRSERRFDAASQRKLYLKLERPQFYALFGDYETNISEPKLTRYVRSFNGIKAEFRGDKVGATAFAADTPFRHRREEIQGNGLSGPYALAVRDILPNSERITIETRDRLQIDRIVESRTLVRYIDYDIDYVAGTLRFKEPILSRASNFDPQFIVADYEVNGVAQRVTNAGGRVTYSNSSKSLQIGATGVRDETENAATSMGGIDVRFRPTTDTEIRVEFAVSDRSAKSNAASPVNSSTNTAWLVEAEHHSAQYDVLAYASQQQLGFGVEQNNGAGEGLRKFGVDGRARISDKLAISGSAWHEQYLNSAANRDAAKAQLEYRGKDLDLRVGATAASDQLSDGRTMQSTIGQIGATKRLFNGRLELDAQTEFAIGGKSESIDFPARHTAGARFHLNDDITLLGSYELTKGDSVDARTARFGVDLKPWTGGRMVASMNQQDIAEYGPRSYAAFGLAQSVPIGEKWTVDFTLDANKTLNGVDATKVLNPLQPIASGGHLGSSGTLTEDFTAATTGASYRGDRWSWVGRAEARSGSLTRRYGLTTSLLRQIGEGEAMGGQVSWFHAEQNSGGPKTESLSANLSWAKRPANSDFSFLEKLEFRSDRVRGATFGAAGPIGGAPLLIDGDAQSKRIVNSFSLNWSPVRDDADRGFMQRHEVALFWGTRYVFDRFGADDIKGWSNVFGADIRFDLGKHVDLGASGTIRQNPNGSSYSFAGGPQISISPVDNSYITIGYNVVGFRDRDFQDTRYTRAGPYVTVRLKFDQNSLAGLGLGDK